MESEKIQKNERDNINVEKNDLLKIVYVEPGAKPYVVEIENNLASFQQAVGGLIEIIYNGDGTLLVDNDEAKLLGLEGNRILDNGAVIAGPFFVVGDDGDNFRSLTEEETKKYMTIFAKPHHISREQVEADMGFFLVSF